MLQLDGIGVKIIKVVKDVGVKLHKCLDIGCVHKVKSTLVEFLRVKIYGEKIGIPILT